MDVTNWMLQTGCHRLDVTDQMPGWQVKGRTGGEIGTI